MFSPETYPKNVGWFPSFSLIKRVSRPSPSHTYLLYQVQSYIWQCQTKCMQIHRGSVQFHIGMDQPVTAPRHSSQLDSWWWIFDGFCESSLNSLEARTCNNIESNHDDPKMSMGGQVASLVWTETNEFPAREWWGLNQHRPAVACENQCNSLYRMCALGEQSLPSQHLRLRHGNADLQIWNKEGRENQRKKLFDVLIE